MEMRRANWFFAFPVTGAFVGEVPAPPTGIRLFEPEDVHLTISFLGSVGRERAETALTELDRYLSTSLRRPVEISLGDVEPFGGSRRSYSALSAVLIDGRDEVTSWVSELRGVLSEAAGVRPETRRVRAHISIARPRRRLTDEASAAGLVWARGLDLTRVRATLDEVALYTWTQDRRTRLFEVFSSRKVTSTLG